MIKWIKSPDRDSLGGFVHLYLFVFFSNRMVKRGTRLKGKCQELLHDLREVGLFLFVLLMVLVVCLLMVGFGISVENQTNKLGVASCSAVEKVVRKICYRQTVNFDGTK